MYQMIETTRVSSADLANLIREREALRARVTELQEDATKKADASLARQVRAFHVKFGHPVATAPAVPPDEVVRFRLRLVTEEFLELLEACFQRTEMEHLRHFSLLRHAVNVLVESQQVSVDLPEFVDAMADLAYVIEGTAATLGVHMAPVLAEVQRSNIAKDPNGPDGKPVKPADWTPPDIRGVLIGQGWRP